MFDEEELAGIPKEIITMTTKLMDNYYDWSWDEFSLDLRQEKEALKNGLPFNADWDEICKNFSKGKRAS